MCCDCEHAFAMRVTAADRRQQWHTELMAVLVAAPGERD